MKLYCKIKRDGKWNWFVGDDPWKVATARALCECRVCRPGKPDIVSQEEGEWHHHANCSNDPCDCPGRKDSTSGVE